MSGFGVGLSAGACCAVLYGINVRMRIQGSNGLDDDNASSLADEKYFELSSLTRRDARCEDKVRFAERGICFLTLGNPTNSRFRARNSPREGLQFSSSMICCEAATIRRSSGIQPSLLQRPRKILPAHQHESLVFQELPELRAANHIEITLSPGGSPIRMI